MKLFRKKKKVHNENWRAWDFFDEEENYGFITYDVTFLTDADSFESNAEFALDIVIPRSMTEDGSFPTPKGHEALIDLEDELLHTLEKARVDCLQVVRLTYDGKRTFVFEVTEVVHFLETLKTWTQKTRHFEINIKKHAPWHLYKQWEPTPYNWQQIENQQVIEQLTRHGSNPTKTHIIECSFGGSQNQLSLLKNTLIRAEGTLLLEKDDLLEITFESSLDPMEIDSLTFFLMDEAANHDCKFEGWRSAIVK